jgi:NAD(P)-dependent dehydrogenase (short-subunit alcohol dehydrogenase family)
MHKTILITGSTDGIGFEAARLLVEKGHHVLLHGKSEEKLQKVYKKLSKFGNVESYLADLSDLRAIKKLSEELLLKHKKLDVLINNAGVLKVKNRITKDGYDVRFIVNTIAPYMLMKNLFPSLDSDGRVVNVSSSALETVNIEALKGKGFGMNDLSYYSQSKLAITMLSVSMAKKIGSKGPSILAVHPGSLLGSKMVKEAFGVEGRDLSIGANLLVRASLSDEFSDASGTYFDNDSSCFTNPHDDVLNHAKIIELEESIEEILC